MAADKSEEQTRADEVFPNLLVGNQVVFCWYFLTFLVGNQVFFCWYFLTFWLATRWFFGGIFNFVVGNQMAAEDAQYLADLGVTHLLNTASGDNQPDGVNLK